MGAAELTCRELVELVTDYFEDALPPAERARFEAHLADCGGCTDYLAQMRATVRLVGATGELEQRPEVAGLMRVFSEWKRAR
jgi:anti-sigma factor RsiW